MPVSLTGTEFVGGMAMAEVKVQDNGTWQARLTVEGTTFVALGDTPIEARDALQDALNLQEERWT